jgi:hypothetical protein
VEAVHSVVELQEQVVAVGAEMAGHLEQLTQVAGAAVLTLALVVGQVDLVLLY